MSSFRESAIPAPCPQPVVLLLDDEQQVTNSLMRSMRGGPARVLTANTVEEAFSILEREPVDVVVADEEMPDMRGTRFLSLVREQYPRAMRIILTGKARLDLVIGAVNEAGVYRYLTKPCAASDLRLCVEQALAARRHEAAAQGALVVAPDLDEAMSRIALVYQPIVRVADRSLYAYEVLLRSEHPRLSQALPLLAAAELAGRMETLNLAIFERILEDARSLPPEILLFVNLRPRDLQETWLHGVENPLLPLAERVVLEITERGTLGPEDDVRHRVRSLRELGFRVAVDDLGSGYSGLSSLAILEPDVVKFDIELTRGIHRRGTRAKLIESMCRLCQELDIRTVAEGVEQPEERDALVRLGAEFLQGYLLARPAKPFCGVDWGAASGEETQG